MDPKGDERLLGTQANIENLSVIQDIASFI